MEILESVAPEEIPDDAEAPGARGIWTGIAQHAIEQHRKGKVAVVRLPDEEAYKRMRNGIGDYLRQRGYLAKPVLRKEDSGVIVYLKLADKNDR